MANNPPLRNIVKAGYKTTPPPTPVEVAINAPKRLGAEKGANAVEFSAGNAPSPSARKINPKNPAHSGKGHAVTVVDEAGFITS
jgi:hypothetical protein